MNDILITTVIFFALYNVIKLISDHLLRYPSLKWGLVAFMAGLGFVVIEILRATTGLIDQYYRNATLPIGILLVFISLGFLIYFFIVNGKKK